MQSAENLEQIKIWESMQGASYWVSVTFDKFKTQENRFFQFQFYKKNLNNFFKFMFWIQKTKKLSLLMVKGNNVH